MAKNVTRLVSDYPTGYYRFSNGGKFLDASTNTTVIANSSRTGSKNQFWHLVNNKLMAERNSDYGLAGTTNAILSQSPLDIAIMYDGPNSCYIRKANEEKYLRISSGNLVWSSTISYWNIERVYRQTNVPLAGTEYFSAKSGMSDGTWNSYWTTYLKNFYRKLYRSTGTIYPENFAQCMYGAIYSVASLPAYYKGKFHTGIDFSGGGGNIIYSPFTGVYKGCNNDFGCVFIYNQYLNCTFVFMHLDTSYGVTGSKNVGDTINEDDPIGIESNVAQDFNLAKHLHIEVLPGDDLDYDEDGNPLYSPLTTYSYENIKSVIPYGAIYQVL